MLVVYSISAFGIPVYFHYCGGTLETVSIITKGSNCCGEDEDSDQSDSCCKNEEIVLKNIHTAIVEQFQLFVKAQFVLPIVPLHQTFACTNNKTLSLSFSSIEEKPPADQRLHLISTFLLRI